MELIDNISEDFSEIVFPYIFDNNQKEHEEIRNVNSWIHAANSRWMGLSVMGRVLSECNTDVLLNYGVTWITISSQIAVMNYESEAIRNLASTNFKKLIKFSSKIPELARNLSSNNISSILEEHFTSKLTNPLSSLKCCKSIVKYFPGPCGPARGKLLRYLLPHMLSYNSSIQDIAIRCWSYIPVCGGGGAGGKDHAAQWEKQCLETTKALDFIVSKLIDGDYTEVLTDPRRESLSLPLPPLPVKEPELSHSLIQRFVALCKCLKSLLENQDLETPVNIPLRQIVTSVQTCCEVTTKNMGHTTEMLLRSKYLINIHLWCVEVLKTLNKSCSRHMSRYSTFLNRIYLNLLNLWKDTSPEPGRSRRFQKIRSSVYRSIAEWLEIVGSKSKFLRGETQIVEVMLDHLVSDIIPTADDIEVNSEETTFRNRGKGKQKKKNNRSSATFQPSRLFDHKANNDVCANALIVVRLCLYSHGAQLSVHVHKSLQEITVVLLQMIEAKKYVAPYQRCDVARKELYHALFALCMCPSMSWPAPTQIAARFFGYGAARDRSLDIRSFCTESGVVLSNIFHPKASSMYRVGSNFAEESLKKYKEQEQKKVHLAASLVEDVDSDDEEESPPAVPSRDAWTSCSDLIETLDKSVGTEFISDELDDTNNHDDVTEGVYLKETSSNNGSVAEDDTSPLSSDVVVRSSLKRKSDRQHEEDLDQSVMTPPDVAKRQRSACDVTDPTEADEDLIASASSPASHQLDETTESENLPHGEVPLSAMLADFVDQSPNEESESSTN